MSTSTTTPARRSPAVAGGRRIAALARAETTLLVRNRTALMNAILLPLAFVGAFAMVADPGGAGADEATTATAVLAMLVVMGLLFVVYYNLTTAYVARREDRVLQRLLTGECTRGEILLAPAVPAAAVVVAQVLVGLAAVTALLDPPGLVNPLLVVVGLLGGLAVIGLFAVATSGLSRTVESVQLTTLPLVVVMLPFAGMFTAPGANDGVFGQIARFTPLRPVVELCWLGLAGTDASGRTLTLAETFPAAAVPVAVLAAWAVVGVLAARRWMRWEPRR
ncbi:ABC transporter permease [Isoptericola sp. BMS4]|uniref:ABC transporter permease n=1 Tax=Isoptericola sp. BMS4 TaxID=2527875 RepID=UPI00141F2011|nr:ABC transporter permease [Isoptericola sp. BMS4]